MEYPVDLSQFDIVQAATIPIRNPETGEPLIGEGGQAITIQVAGVDSDRFHQRQYELAEARSKSKDRPTGQELDADRIETLSVCITGWSGITLDGQPLPYSAENAKALMLRLPWLANQVDRSIVDRALHFKKAQPAAAAESEAPKPSKAKRTRRAAA